MSKYTDIKIESCTISDVGAILELYEFARELQRKKKTVTWPIFEKKFIESEIIETRQWKLVLNGKIVCNWAITYTDPDIWEEKETGDAVYLHRIATHPDFRGNHYIHSIVEWAKIFASKCGRNYIRLDTLGDNTKLIQHYCSAGFNFLGVFYLKDISKLPAHYRSDRQCLLFEIEVN